MHKNVPAPEWRYERKMLPPAIHPATVEHRIRLHPAGFKEVYPPREVNNLYLDTLERTDFHEHVQGISARSKTRIRWYGPLNGTIEQATLELKIKRGAVGYKKNYAITDFALTHAADTAALRSVLRELPAPVRAGVELRRPSLVNRYTRRYYLSADGLVRLTLDAELQYYDPRHPTRPLNHPACNTPPLIIELKYAPDDAKHAASIANKLPFRIGRYSKYVEGVRRLLPSRP